MTANEIRNKFLEFFKSKGHVIVPSASLVPENDPTVLFTTAGMHPLVPYLLGQNHPGGKRLVSSQKCVRTDDIDEVGDNVHLTFFEMLGNWSLGDYWKKEAIEWSYEFLTGTDWLGLPVEKLAVSVFAGDKNAPRDDESAKIWKSLGIPENRIVYLPKESNWWGPAGITGPCGPDTEIFCWTGKDPAPEKFDPKNAAWVEVWNDVFMQYDKQAHGKFAPLKQKNVDTGMGLERMAAVMQGKDNIYETELFMPVIDQIKLSASIENEKAQRIIADHIRASVFLISDGILPSNKERGYVLRRLIRRAVRYGQIIGIKKGFLNGLAGKVIDNYQSFYPELEKNSEKIFTELGTEDEKFRKTLEKGLKEFEKSGELDGKKAFDLFQTYGFPLELTMELAGERRIKINKKEFEEEFKKHQGLSRTASAGTFKGGLADHSEITTRLHTATHLLQAGLRRVLGDQVFQRGSNINAERTRFDFNFAKKVTTEELKEVEDWVNEQIGHDLPVAREIMSPDEARKLGAIGLFDEKYGEQVSIYTIQNPDTGEIVSREFCGGPHVERTGLIGKFKIIKEEAVAAGIRRIKATVE